MKPKKKKMPGNSNSKQNAEVEFSYAAPEANEVYLAGSFNDWNPTNLSMRRDPQGVWRLRVVLPAARHEYRFIADGIWNDDPRACAYVPNQFGWCNCVVEVAPTGSQGGASAKGEITKAPDALEQRSQSRINTE